MVKNFLNKTQDFYLNGYVCDDSNVRLYWDAVEDAIYYNLYDNAKKVNETPNTDVKYLLNNQKPNKIHKYYIEAICKNDIKKYSNVRNLAVIQKKNNSDHKFRLKSKIPISDIAKKLEFIGVVVNDPRYHYWCTSAIIDDEGKTHLFTSRVPIRKDVSFGVGWKIDCEIAHFIADSPKGPFEEVETVFNNDNLPKGMWSAHNSKIRKIDDTYCLLFIVQTSSSVETQKTILATSKSLYGPWTMQGENGHILDFHKRNVNPDLMKYKGKYYLYFKTVGDDKKTAFHVSVADKLTGPYQIIDEPIVDGMTIEDLNVFSYQNMVYMLSTDNFGKSGYKGAGLLWQSNDAIKFNWKNTKLGFGKMNDYIKMPKGRKLNYGSTWDKHERPDILFVNNKPAFLYVTGGTSIDGIDSCQNYVYKIHN